MSQFWGYASGAEATSPAPLDATPSAPKQQTPQTLTATASTPITGPGPPYSYAGIGAAIEFPLGAPVLVHRIVLQIDTGPCDAYVFVGYPAAETVVSLTHSGDADVNELARPLYVPQGVPLWVVWLVGAGNAIVRVDFEAA